jgi:hypothetical protein
MFTEIYRHLKENGFDVYSIGQHQGICKSPYIVIKENGESEIIGTSLTNDIVELLIYYPIGTYSKLNEYKQSTLYSMKLLKGIRRVIEPMPTIIDDDKKAYMTSFTYRKIKTKEGV